jgi:hypothetical protein
LIQLGFPQCSPNQLPYNDSKLDDLGFYQSIGELKE